MARPLFSMIVFLPVLFLFASRIASASAHRAPKDLAGGPTLFGHRRSTLSKLDSKTGKKDISLHQHFVLRGGGAETAELVEHAYEWATNLGAPAALVAGAVIATLYESMSSGNLDVEEDDKKWVKLAKKVSFARPRPLVSLAPKLLLHFWLCLQCPSLVICF